MSERRSSLPHEMMALHAERTLQIQTEHAGLFAEMVAKAAADPGLELPAAFLAVRRVVNASAFRAASWMLATASGFDIVDKMLADIDVDVRCN